MSGKKSTIPERKEVSNKISLIKQKMAAVFKSKPCLLPPDDLRRLAKKLGDTFVASVPFAASNEAINKNLNGDRVLVDFSQVENKKIEDSS